jgi:hypothetical protein
MNGMLATAIPFRQQQATDVELIALALGVTALVLVAFVAAAWVGRQRGWWRRWSVAPSAIADEAPLVVEQVLPVSRETRVFVLRHGDRRWLLSESARTTAWTTVSESPSTGALPDSSK